MQATALLASPHGCLVASPSGVLTSLRFKASVMHHSTGGSHLVQAASWDAGAATLGLAPVYVGPAALPPGVVDREATGAVCISSNSKGVSARVVGGHMQQAGQPGDCQDGVPGALAGTLLGGLLAVQQLGQQEVRWLAPLQAVMEELLVTAPVGRLLVCSQGSGASGAVSARLRSKDAAGGAAAHDVAEAFLDLDLLLQYCSLPLAMQLQVAERLVQLLPEGRGGGQEGVVRLAAQQARASQAGWLVQAAEECARAAAMPAVCHDAVKLHMALLMVLDGVAQRCSL